MAGLRVLICDDEQSICMLLEDILRRFGHEAVSYQDGPGALARVEQEEFDLFFLDIRMPGMDGTQVMQRIRELRPGAKCVMITGYAQDELMEKCIQGGAHACMAKPFSLLSLKKLLEEVESRGGEEARSRGVETATA